MIRALVLLAPIALWGCGPMPVDLAEKSCLESAKLAAHPRGKVFFGVDGKGRHFVDGSIGISTDYLAGKDPEAVFNACVQGRSGMMPITPLYAQPGWTP